MDAHPTVSRAFAWAGAVLFAASLLYFLFSYSVTFGEIVPGRPDWRAVVTDVALFSVFALHHSIFARNPVREFVRSRIPPQLERSAYVWVASLMLIGVCAAWRTVPGMVWQLWTPWTWILMVVQLAAVWLTLRSAAVIDGLDLAGVRQVLTPNPHPPTPKTDKAQTRAEQDWELGIGNWEFKTTGPYGWVRHPIYLGWILLVFAVGTMTMTRLAFAVISSVYMLIAIPFEERTLRVNSGGAYDEYMRRVPWKLFPYLF